MLKKVCNITIRIGKSQSLLLYELVTVYFLCLLIPPSDP
jgi:hypothetical protein